MLPRQGFDLFRALHDRAVHKPSGLGATRDLIPQASAEGDFECRLSQAGIFRYLIPNEALNFSTSSTRRSQNG